MALMPVCTGVSTDLRVMTPGRHALDGAGRRRGDGTLVVDGPAERVHDAADERGADGHLDHGARRLDGVALLDLRVVAQDDRADGLLLEVEGHALDAAGELEELRGQRALQAVDAGDAVADLDDGARPSASRRRRRTRRWRT